MTIEILAPKRKFVFLKYEEPVYTVKDQDYPLPVRVAEKHLIGTYEYDPMPSSEKHVRELVVTGPHTVTKKAYQSHSTSG